jgi:hypothetical protein
VAQRTPVGLWCVGVVLAVVNLIGSTTTRTDLKVRAELDQSSNPLGTEITDNQLAAVDLKPHRFPRRVKLHNRRPPTNT